MKSSPPALVQRQSALGPLLRESAPLFVNNYAALRDVTRVYVHWRTHARVHAGHACVCELPLFPLCKLLWGAFLLWWVFERHSATTGCETHHTPQQLLADCGKLCTRVYFYLRKFHVVVLLVVSISYSSGSASAAEFHHSWTVLNDRPGCRPSLRPGQNQSMFTRPTHHRNPITTTQYITITRSHPEPPGPQSPIREKILSVLERKWPLYLTREASEWDVRVDVDGKLFTFSYQEKHEQKPFRLHLWVSKI